MNVQITEKGTFPIGLVVDGVLQRDFELRPLTVGDQVEATMEVGSEDSTRLGSAIYARQLVRLGNVSHDKITTSLLLQLNPADWNAIDRAAADLQKKLLRDGPISGGGQPVAQSSPATA